MAERGKRRDPIQASIDAALQFGDYIGWNEGFTFVCELAVVEKRIAPLVASEPVRAVALYESFIADCNDKAEEVDDSDGEFATFVSGLYRGWIEARQAAGADRGETAQLLLSWMRDDSYGFCDDLEREAAKVLDRDGRNAFEREVRILFEKASSERERQRWAGSLKSIYERQRDLKKYIDLAVQTGIGRHDYETIGALYQAKGRLNDGLDWLEKGLKHDPEPGSKLAEMRRALLAKLGRRGEALDSAWAEFEEEPCKVTYEELFRYVPKAERAAWRDKAMAASEKGRLDSQMELWLAAKDFDRLAARLDRAGDRELQALSHYTSEPAAKRLAKTHPGVAAKVFRALCVRIVNAGKSQYYYEALSNLEKAKTCYQQAGLDAQWKNLIDEIRRDHSRKTGFMPGFERIVAGRPIMKRA